MSASTTERFGLGDILRTEETPGGLTRVAIAGPEADAAVYLQGAHIAEWTPRGQRPVLFTSSRSRFERGIPIRGGVPIAFPWFGPRADGVAGPLHGYARITEWKIESAQVRPDGAVELLFGMTGEEGFQLQFRAAFGTALEMELTVRNEAASALRFEEALHTYFAVSDVRQVSIDGLAGTTCIDKTAGGARRECSGPIRIAKETDQVHLNTDSRCDIVDPGANRTIVVEKSGSQTTVVWNPWIEKCKTLADMAPDEWTGMVCVETANALENAVVVPAGGVHRMQAVIRVT